VFIFVVQFKPKSGIVSLRRAMKHILHILLFFFLATHIPSVVAQVNNAQKHIVVIAGQNYTDSILSRFQPSLSLVEKCVLKNITLSGSQNYTFTISPDPSNPNFIGNAKAIIQYTDGLPVKPRYITYYITYVASTITTKPDFVTFDSESEIEIKPLLNDVSSATGLVINGLGHIQGGSASSDQYSVYFKPESDVENAFILYSVKNSAGSTANGMVYLMKKNTVYAAIDTLRFNLLNTHQKFLFMPDLGFKPLTNPTKGQLTQVHDRVYSYVPFKGSTGTDMFTLSDSKGQKRVVIATLSDKSQNTTSVRDDQFYTPKNTAITFDVLANDLSSNFPISAYSAELVKVANGKFTYTPPVGFSGIKNFTYTVNYGTFQSTGKVVLNVGNYAPQSTLEYRFNTLKNHALAVSYNVPIKGYSFKVLNQPQFGVAEVFDEKTSLQVECNTVSSKALLLYSPDQNYYGADSFDIEYCVPNNACVVYKVYVQVHDHQLIACPCQGLDCVWAGDLNGDGRVSVSDLMPLGRFIGLGGSKRDDIKFPFSGGQAAKDWAYIQPNGLNIKHIDSNGDGLLSTADTTSISQNYGNIHSFVPDEVLAIKEYPFELIPNTTELDSGDLLILDVVVGSDKKPAIDVLGLAFALNFSPSIFVPGTLNAEIYSDSWLTKGNPSIHMVNKPKASSIHIGVVKAGAVVTDEVDGFKPPGASGNGKIGKIYAVVTDEVDGFRSKDSYITRRIVTDGIELEDADGVKFRIPDTFVDIRINKNNQTPVPSENKLLAFPNPASDAIQLHFNGNNIIKGFRMYNAMGSLMESMSDIERQSHTIQTSHLPQGVYLLQVVTTQGVISKKIKIVSSK
jgi:hypothetical protein